MVYVQFSLFLNYCSIVHVLLFWNLHFLFTNVCDSSYFHFLHLLIFFWYIYYFQCVFTLPVLIVTDVIHSVKCVLFYIRSKYELRKNSFCWYPNFFKLPSAYRRTCVSGVVCRVILAFKSSAASKLIEMFSLNWIRMWCSKGLLLEVRKIASCFIVHIKIIL